MLHGLTGVQTQGILKRSLAFMLELLEADTESITGNTWASIAQCFDADTSGYMRRVGSVPERDIVTVEAAINAYQKMIRYLPSVNTRGIKYHE